MGLLSKIKEWTQKRRNTEQDESGFDEWCEQAINRDDVDIHDHQQREEYVTACLEQMAEASRELDTLNGEYNLVTSYLTDMEEVDSLEKETRQQIRDFASKIIELENNKEKIYKKHSVMSEEDYARMEKIEQYMPEAYNKLKKAEDYQVLVKKDLGRLEGERHAYRFRRNEIESNQTNMKWITAICVGSMCFLIMVLAIVGAAWKIDVSVGYWIAILVAAFTMTIVYVRYHDAQKELVKVDKSINKLVLLQNSIKIKYVNNTNLLEYLYVKYNVNSSIELKALWDKYNEENRQRQEREQMRQDMDYNQASLIKLLRKSNIQDPDIWLHQAQALIDNKEMVEIRHNLILRRQKLRKRMEYNARMAQDAQDEVKDIVNKYPEYAKKILDLVSDYEKALA